jgi:carboxymethylenebutenolidase
MSDDDREAAMAGELVDIATAEGRRTEADLALPESGNGPGLVLFRDVDDDDRDIRDLANLYAEEGYVVLWPQPFTTGQGAEDVAAAVASLRGRPECTGKAGALGFGLGGRFALFAAIEAGIDCAVSYYGFGIDYGAAPAARIGCPLTLHLAENDPKAPAHVIAQVREAFAARPDVAIYVYRGVSPGFDRMSRVDYDRPAAGLAHSRTIAVLRRAIGPYYDLEALWEKHTAYEFVERDVAATMRTMVAEPYVNHIPVMTGGVGQTELARFYAHHFIPKCPADFRLVPVSRTLGPDRLVDEFVVSFTHDVEIDWMLPGIAPTGRRVEVPTVAIVNFRGGKLCHEHIYWDQASVLVQIGLLDPDGLPVAGAETAKKLLDETRPSNTLMRRWAESAPDKNIQQRE